MCELAMGWLPKVEVSRVEEELGGESRTLRTIEHLRSSLPDKPLRFIMGSDLVVESSKWFGFERIAALAPPIVLGRAGISYPGAPASVLPAISSTEIRAAFGEGASAISRLAELVPRDVIAYALSHRLYAHPKEREE
jgi:nicotinate-nucleotide adenylyltransferase